MDDAFDPYEAWLGIPASKRPPTPWDLLGLDEGETDPDRIGQAAAARYEEIRSLALGPQGEHAQRLLDEISEALVFLSEVAPEDIAKIKLPPPLPITTEKVEQPLAPPPLPDTAVLTEPLRKSRRVRIIPALFWITAP